MDELVSILKRQPCAEADDLLILGWFINHSAKHGRSV